MGLNRAVGTFDNAGVPAPSGNFGPFSLPTTLKLLRADVVIEVIPTIQAWSSSTTLIAAAMVGMQVVFAGDPPFNLPGDAGLVNFLDHMPITDADWATAWSPTTDTANVVVKSERTLHYAGQKFFGAALDFYVTWGSTYVADNQEYSGYYELIYTT